VTGLPFDLPDPVAERELNALVTRERLARDTGDWDLLTDLYWPDSTIRVTWFTGTIAQFVAVSRDQHQRGRGRGMHVIDPFRCLVSGDRAMVESRGQILIRPRLDGIECDVTSWGRFVSTAERRGGVWRLVTFDTFYGKDRIDPVIPGVNPRLDQRALDEARSSYRFLTCLNRLAGYEVPDDLPGDDRPDLVEAFFAALEAWVRAGSRSR
jgi:hypothetical protein